MDGYHMDMIKDDDEDDDDGEVGRRRRMKTARWMRDDDHKV